MDTAVFVNSVLLTWCDLLCLPSPHAPPSFHDRCSMGWNDYPVCSMRGLSHLSMSPGGTRPLHSILPLSPFRPPVPRTLWLITSFLHIYSLTQRSKAKGLVLIGGFPFLSWRRRGRGGTYDFYCDGSLEGSHCTGCSIRGCLAACILRISTKTSITSTSGQVLLGTHAVSLFVITRWRHGLKGSCPVMMYGWVHL
jgi:hypothetical protein